MYHMMEDHILLGGEESIARMIIGHVCAVRYPLGMQI